MEMDGNGELDPKGNFNTTLSIEILEDGSSALRCYAKLQNASDAACPIHSTKVASMKLVVSEHNATLETKNVMHRRIKFLPVTCQSAFFWHSINYTWRPNITYSPICHHPHGREANWICPTTGWAATSTVCGFVSTTGSAATFTINSCFRQHSISTTTSQLQSSATQLPSRVPVSSPSHKTDQFFDQMLHLPKTFILHHILLSLHYHFCHHGCGYPYPRLQSHTTHQNLYSKSDHTSRLSLQSASPTSKNISSNTFNTSNSSTMLHLPKTHILHHLLLPSLSNPPNPIPRARQSQNFLRSQL